MTNTYTEFIEACKSGDYTTVETLLLSKAKVPVDRGAMICNKEGNFEILKLILSKCNPYKTFGYPPTHYYALDRVDMALALLDNLANPEHIKKLKSKKYAYLDHGLDDSYRDELDMYLKSCCRHKHYEVAALVIQRLSSFGMERPEYYDYDPAISIWEVCESGDMVMVKVMLDNYGSQVCESMLYPAWMSGKIDIVALLFERCRDEMVRKGDGL